MARLVWKRNEESEKSFLLGRTTLLGRESTADCVLKRDSVSRRHARVEQRGGSFYILDLGSTNGTLINGARIDCEALLAQGDIIQLGDETLEFSTEESTAGVTRGSMPTETLAAQAKSDTKAATTGGGELLPRRAGRFYLLERLGRGGMGVVYHALDLDSNREVAVKFIQSHIGRREAFLDFFHRREAVLAREINHPNVIRINEYGVDRDHHYISMEFVPGKNLFQTMRSGRLSPTEVLEILRQIACGLTAAHRHGVVHSDIKPANILLVPKTADAGSADGESGEEPAALLEFDEADSAPTVTQERKPRVKDPSLLAEIERRLGKPSPDLLVDPPYFPRPSELRFLQYYLARTREEHGFFIVVEGEAGVGKDRLISHFFEHCKLEKNSAVKAPPTRCFLELDCSRIEGLPRLYEQFFGVGPAVRGGLRGVAEDLIRSLKESQELHLIRVLNLGGATSLVTDFLNRCADLMAEHKLLVVGALNPEELRRNDSLNPLLERIKPVMKELYLRPLTEYQIQRYLTLIFKDVFHDPELGNDLHRLSGGNFAKLLDVLRGFFERGVLSLDLSGRLVYKPRTREVELEEGKNFFERYRSLGRVEQRVLESAAFIGDRFLFDTLLRFHEIDETSLFFIVRTMLAEGYFSEEDRTWYAFTNLPFRNYIAGKVPERERPHLHRKLVRLLESVPVRDSPELCFLRGQHYVGCHEYGKAVRAYLEGTHLARSEYKEDLRREMCQEILRVYRGLANRIADRKEVVGVLRSWFGRDGNWYKLLGDLGSGSNSARVKITDFGISFRTRDEERGYSVEKRPILGTPRYLAPERARGEIGGPPADMFSLGIIAYEMVVGSPPFKNLKGNAVIQANRDRRITIADEALEGYPSGTADVIHAMLEKDPRRRWHAERVLAEVAKLQLKVERQEE